MDEFNEFEKFVDRVKEESVRRKEKLSIEFVDCVTSYYDGPDVMLGDAVPCEVDLSEVRKQYSDIDDEDAVEWVKALGTPCTVSGDPVRRMKSDNQMLQEISDKLSTLIELMSHQVG